jgi:hypothetical protein
MNRILKLSQSSTGQTDSKPLSKSSALCLVVALTLATLLTATTPEEALATPNLTITQDTANFGTVPTRSSLFHRYWLHSTGSTELVIEWTDPSCPCAEMPLAETVIQPGDSVAYVLILRSGLNVGSYQHKPHVKTNADDETTRLWFECSIVGNSAASQPLGFSPFRADLSQFGEFRRDTARITMSNNSEDPISGFNMLSQHDPYYTVHLPDSIAAKGKADCLITNSLLTTGAQENWRGFFELNNLDLLVLANCTQLNSYDTRNSTTVPKHYE